MRTILIQRTLSLILLLLIAKDGITQTDLRVITPLSPNAAEMVKYGETPVDNFTGTTGISIPLYTIVSGELQLPLSLSYHGGGNKVESIASWVGLSWNLGAIPRITRTVNGRPDEDKFFNLYRGYTAKQLLDQYVASQHDASVSKDDFVNYMAEVKEGTADSEPDIYAFNINGKSGKFYYNQELKKFVVTPFTNIIITYNNNSFTIVSDDGTKYNFSATDTETGATQTSTPGAAVITSWMITSIQSASGTDVINFNYIYEQNLIQSVSAETKYQMVDGNTCEHGPVDVGFSAELTTLNTRRLDVISFRGGYVKFITNANTREDLFGGHALDAVKVFSDKGQLIRHFSFNYKYLVGTGEVPIYRSNKWMLLSELKENAIDNSTALVHSFQYDESTIPPNRYSTAQDYWGFYNGALTNTTLIPETVFRIPSGNIMYLSGANRAVNPAYTQFAILKKITYPAGGYTELDYENTKVVSSVVPALYIKKVASVEANTGEFPAGEENLPNHKVYLLDFTINNPPDQQLNLNNENGGAYIKVELDGLGVPEGSQGATTILKGTSASNSNIFYAFSGGFQNRYLPNGNYQIVATFDQNPPNYQDFFCMVTWKEKDASSDYTYAGGLRIKEIRTYDAVKAPPLVKKYLYVNDLTSGTCSGEILGQSNFTYHNFTSVATGDSWFCTAVFVRLKSYSNQAQVTHSGSYVGYKKVFVQSSSPEQTGYTSYLYTFEKDVAQNGFPYPPASSNESFRGQLKEQEDFVFVNGSFQLVKKISNKYRNISKDEQVVFAIKTDPDIVSELSNIFRAVPFVEYELTPTWSSLSETTELIYDKDIARNISIVTENVYDESYCQLTETQRAGSDGKVRKTINYYPYDLMLSGEAEAARNWLVTANRISNPIKQESYVDNSLKTSTTSTFKNFDGLNLVLPQSVSVHYGVNTNPKAVYFDSYNNSGNLLAQHKANDIVYSYVWGYNQLYPIAEVVNAAAADIFYTSFEEGDGNSADNDCKTGRKSKTNGFSKTITGLSNGSYLLSYWQKNANNWTLQVNTITVSGNAYDINVSGQIDEVRLCPADAQMTTSTYDPLVGITSQCDVSNRIVYYEYDAFNRLKLIKDHDGNIIKTFDYHYRNN